MHMRTLHRSLPGRTGIRQRALDEESILVDVLLVARIGDRGEQGLGDDLRAFLGVNSRIDSA